jgi:hypothetical protein
MKENKTGGRGDKYIKYQSKNGNGRYRLENICVNWRIILKEYAKETLLKIVGNSLAVQEEICTRQ